MKIIKHKINDDLLVEEDTILESHVSGSAIVSPGKTLIIKGILEGNVVLEENSRVELTGTVNGDIFNQGGVFIKKGVLKGDIVDNN